MYSHLYVFLGFNSLIYKLVLKILISIENLYLYTDTSKR